MTFGLLATGADLGFAGGMERHGVGDGMGCGRYGVHVAGEAMAPGADDVDAGFSSAFREGGIQRCSAEEETLSTSSCVS